MQNDDRLQKSIYLINFTLLPVSIHRFLLHLLNLPICLLPFGLSFNTAPLGFCYFHSQQVLFPLVSMYSNSFLTFPPFTLSNVKQPSTFLKNIIYVDSVLFKSFCFGTQVSLQCGNVSPLPRKLQFLHIFLILFLNVLWIVSYTN